MAKILKGKEVADAINNQLIIKTGQLKERGIIPTLAILRVGERPDDLSYERGAKKKCQAVNAKAKVFDFPVDVTEADLVSKLEELNQDKTIHGILMFRPLPKHIDEERVRNLISPEKDVDGCTNLSLAGVFTNVKLGFSPCTAEAVIELLKHYDIPLAGKNVTIIGRSLVIGRPVAMLLMHENATVTICHTKTKDLPKITKNSDIIVAASGQMESIGADFFSKGQIVIDVGISWNEEKSKLCGDVKFEEADEIVASITPVPGGVGGITSCILVKHVVEAADRQNSLDK